MTADESLDAGTGRTGIPDECELCRPLDYRGDEINEPTHSTEIANKDGGSKIIYHCRRCGLELWDFDEASPLTDEIEGGEQADE